MNIETIYNDFTTNMLPAIQEGLTITKEYFADLFGRYVTYLIVVDSIWAFVYIILTIVTIVGTVKVSKHFYKNHQNDPFGNSGPATVSTVILGSLVGLLFTVSAIESVVDVVGDIFIPEVRVYEELKGFSDNQ